VKKWYESVGPHGEIVISSRVRLARNYVKFPFPGGMTQEQQQALLESVASVMTESAGGREFTLTDLTNGDPLFAQSLMERHLISPEFAGSKRVHGIILSRDESISVMVGEEDHLRIQALGSGLCLQECLKAAMAVDDLLERTGEYAFDEHLGYLTHCPTNLGTGLRASVMLHLPALTEAGPIRDMILAAGKLGFAVRGLYGEGTRSSGALYQISNQVSMGISEEETIGRLSEAVNNILRSEQELRSRMLKERPEFADRLWRAAGILASARSISSRESMELLSQLRLGVAVGELGGVSIEQINQLLRDTQPASLSLLLGGGSLGSEAERDAKRAKMIRDTVKQVLVEEINK
jgi:protein arginine kinase